MGRVDLNGDVGEGADYDEELMLFITSANIACGAHAGDEATMRATVKLAMSHGVAIGAHPGFADRENFGRKEIAMEPLQAAEMVLAQIQKLQAIALQLGTTVHHVKLHGALYNMASRDQSLAEAIVKAIWVTEKNPVLYALAGSVLERVAQEHGDFKVVSEVFADRTYQADGSLTPRSQSDAQIAEENLAVAQVLRMVREGKVRSTNGSDVAVKADTICLHGDGPQAVAFARRLCDELRVAGIELKACSE